MATAAVLSNQESTRACTRRAASKKERAPSSTYGVVGLKSCTRLGGEGLSKVELRLPSRAVREAQPHRARARLPRRERGRRERFLLKVRRRRAQIEGTPELQPRLRAVNHQGAVLNERRPRGALGPLLCVTRALSGTDVSG